MGLQLSACSLTAHTPPENIQHEGYVRCSLAIAAVAVAEEEVADQKTDEQFLTAFRYGYPYASAAYVAPTSYVAPTTYVAPASVAAPVHVKYATSLPAYTYTAGAYPYTYPSTLGVRSTAY